jgi:hypothetical protein
MKNTKNPTINNEEKRKDEFRTDFKVGDTVG